MLQVLSNLMVCTIHNFVSWWHSEYQGFHGVSPFCIHLLFLPSILKGNPRHQKRGKTRDSSSDQKRPGKRPGASKGPRGSYPKFGTLVGTVGSGALFGPGAAGGIVNSKPTGTPKFYCFFTMALFVVAGSSISLLEQWRVEIVNWGNWGVFMEIWMFRT